MFSSVSKKTPPLAENTHGNAPASREAAQEAVEQIQAFRRELAHLADAEVLRLSPEQEQAVLRRGKNSSKATVAKHATPQEYRASTAIEALFGWLYLQKQNDRIEELFDIIWNTVYLKQP